MRENVFSSEEEFSMQEFLDNQFQNEKSSQEKRKIANKLLSLNKKKEREILIFIIRSSKLFKNVSVCVKELQRGSCTFAA
jgi:hypothetical protein